MSPPSYECRSEGQKLQPHSRPYSLKY
ncbi:TPA: hypothetical protein EYP37_00485 [Candidatus Poribacteria bacterium]|nr:hypothetical protein [Candidatus Poribacteria bacterium]